ncbi:MAG: DNA adenine methylase [Polyangiaceae bacterium]|nr:DNA adenine methylase [Polyangiaceae bacterium]MCE7890253.1 DNA adenine methylase [Sorangiineae bacterium PRO1]MCL4755426.1 DNA adenine methylase [Myxococcales bacterium]
MTLGAPARPVLKWAGGKTQLLPKILARLPERIDTYFEPFVGGAAVFFALAARGSFRRAVLADRNPDLVAVYRALQQDVEGVIRALGRMSHSESEYYRVRALSPRGLVQRAARIIYLNKTGYNGLYRVNRSGQFNVPFGKYKNPNFCDAENLRAAAAALQGVEIAEADFEAVCARARPGDAVYLDPPYVPLSKTSYFTAYDRHPFGQLEHERLARVFAELEGRGVDAVLSNSNTPETRALYRGFRAEKVKVARNINSRASARGPIDELLVVAEPAPRRVKRPRSRAS